MSPIKTVPSWRTGWTWALIKCGIATAITSVVATVGMLFLLQSLVDKLPEWMPDTWARWLFDWTLSHVWFLGPAVGVVAGLIASTGIILFDAKRGRLSRLK